MKSAKLWDIFCQVVDNYGDIGVCWRLASDLAARGHQIRLWVDDPSALSWMAPGVLEGHRPQVQVMPWQRARDPKLLNKLVPADVWIEAFGCEIAAEFLAQRFNPGRQMSGAAATPPVWVNLEYLSAESFVERTHGLPSPTMHGPAKGHTRHFFYPGLTSATGGLLRETDLAARQASFNRIAWLARQGVAWQGERLVSLFCYEPDPLADLLAQLRLDPRPTRLLITHGRATAAIRGLEGHAQQNPQVTVPDATGSLSLVFLSPLAQTDFDHLLWSCDLNFVRGEDSLVRAIWAGKPFVWHIYPQHDLAHHAKLQAFLDAMDAPQSWRRFHLAWNGIAKQSLEQPDLNTWGEAALRARERLIQQDDLVRRLIKFVDCRQRGPDWLPQIG